LGRGATYVVVRGALTRVFQFNRSNRVGKARMAADEYPPASVSVFEAFCSPPDDLLCGCIHVRTRNASVLVRQSNSRPWGKVDARSVPSGPLRDGQCRGLRKAVWSGLKTVAKAKKCRASRPDCWPRQMKCRRTSRSRSARKRFGRRAPFPTARPAPARCHFPGGPQRLPLTRLEIVQTPRHRRLALA
jgi:hypothetical protein